MKSSKKRPGDLIEDNWFDYMFDQIISLSYSHQNLVPSVQRNFVANAVGTTWHLRSTIAVTGNNFFDSSLLRYMTKPGFGFESVKESNERYLAKRRKRWTQHVSDHTLINCDIQDYAFIYQMRRNCKLIHKDFSKIKASEATFILTLKNFWSKCFRRCGNTQ